MKLTIKCFLENILERRAFEDPYMCLDPGNPAKYQWCRLTGDVKLSCYLEFEKRWKEITATLQSTTFKQTKP